MWARIGLCDAIHRAHEVARVQEDRGHDWGLTIGLMALCTVLGTTGATAGAYMHAAPRLHAIASYDVRFIRPNMVERLTKEDRARLFVWKTRLTRQPVPTAPICLRPAHTHQ